MRGSQHEGWNKVESTLSPSAVSGLSTLWTKPLVSDAVAPASGSPIVVGQYVYVGGSGVARRTVTGASSWQTSLGGPVQTTPAYGHGIVVAANSNRNSTIAALDAQTGAVLWERTLQGTISSSPSIFETTTYVGLAVKSGGFKVLALWLSSGKTKWKWTTSDTTFGLVSSPTTDGQGVYFSLAGGTRVVALDALTGAPRWDLVLDTGNGWTMDGLMTSLLGGQLYVGNVAGGVYDLDPATGHVVWHRSLNGPIWRSVVSTPSALLVSKNDATVVALSPADGTTLWAYTPGGLLSPAMSTADGVAYVGGSINGAGHLDALDLGTGALLKRVNLVNSCEPMAPAISSGKLFVAECDSLLALGLKAA